MTVRGKMMTGSFIAVSAALALSASIVVAGPGGAAVAVQGNVTGAAPPSSLLDVALFYVVAGLTVICALGVCISKNIVRMAVWLFGALGAVALLYFLLAANFVAAIQLIVYVGGTLILLIFGVMLTSKSPWVRYHPPKLEVLAAAVVCIALLVALCMVLTSVRSSGTEEMVPGAAVADIGRQLITTFLVPFEVAGILLMIVMVGAAHLARQEK